MKDPMALGAPLAIVLFAAMAAAALRFGGQTAEAATGARQRTAPVTVTVMAHESRPQPAMTTGTHDGAGPEIFHELHAEGRNALCPVCDGQYRARIG
jgi:hypothetical protein